MYKHLEDQFPGREKQLEQLGNVTVGVSILTQKKKEKRKTPFLFTLPFFYFSLNIQITVHKVYLYTVHLPQERQH